MGISLELPRASERVKMKQEGDLVSLSISISAIWCFMISVSLGIAFALNSVLKWIPNTAWMLIVAGIALGLASIGILASSLTRGRFIYKKEQKREAAITEKVEHIKKIFKEWLAGKYMDGALHTVSEPEGFRHFDRYQNVHIMRLGETFEIPRNLEVSFADLEEVYPKNEADKESDGEIRERVFDDLEFSRILQVGKRHETYIFKNTGEYPQLFEGYKVDHWDMMNL